MSRQANPRVEAWREAVARGIAVELAERIVRERDVPAALLALVYGRPSPSRHHPRGRGLDGELHVRDLLSDREKIMLQLTAAGFRERAVAAYFQIAAGTVRSNLKWIRLKLAAKTTTEAVAIAFRLGMIS